MMQAWRIQQAHNLLVEALCRIGFARRFNGAPELPGTEIKKLLFVCSGNICRSPYAEYRMKKLIGEPSSVEIISRGLHTSQGKTADATAMRIALSRGIDLSRHRTGVFELSEAEDADIILVMDALHISDIQERYPTVVGKTRLLGAFGRNRGTPFVFRDPFGLTEMYYEKSFSDIDAATEGLATLMRASHNTRT